jgi:hypothetical protein
MMGFEAVFPASSLTYDDYVVFLVYATKDTRSAFASATIHAYEIGQTNVSAALDTIDAIDALLKKGDVNGALAFMNTVTAQLNGGPEVS